MPFKDILVKKIDIRHRTMIREFMAECAGTFTLLIIGNSVIAANVLKGKEPEPFNVCFAYGVGAMIATLSCGHLSGAHINPAGTVAQALLNNFPWRKVWYYLTAQYLAGFVSSVVIWIVYYDAFYNFNFEKDDRKTIFTTFPYKGLTIRGVLVDQTVGTAMLFFSISAIGNTKGFIMPKFAQALSVCILITGCCLAFGLNAGAIFNPARDLTPRLFAWIVCGQQAMEPLDFHYWWAAGVVGPHLGAILGTYLFMVVCDCYSEEQESEMNKTTFRIDATSKSANQNESTMSIC